MRAREALAAALALTVAFATLVALVRDDDRLDVKLAAARDFEGFPLLWVGKEFEGLQLVHVDVPGRSGFATFIYGDCDVEDPDGFFSPEGGSCSPSLGIQVSPLCSHLTAMLGRLPQRRSIRGAPVGLSGTSGPVLFTRGAQVKASRGQGSSPGLALRALGALRSLNAVPPLVAATGPIPAPDRRILEGTRPCRDSRGGVVSIDEFEGTYRGVGIGASAEEVRRTFGARAFARLNHEPWTPRRADFTGGPHVLAPPCRPTGSLPGGRSRLQVLRYDEVSFLFCDGRVFAFMVIEQGARTQAGLAIGDELEAAERLYPGLACGQAPSGDTGSYPYCVGRMRPRRSFWLGPDPIGSITFSTIRFGRGRA